MIFILYIEEINSDLMFWCKFLTLFAGKLCLSTEFLGLCQTIAMIDSNLHKYVDCKSFLNNVMSSMATDLQYSTTARSHTVIFPG